jgi:hypothetical protein
MDHQQLNEAPKEKPVVRKQVDAPVHEDAKRKNIPTAEYESVMAKEDHTPIELAYQRRNRDLDPPCGIKFNSNFQWSTTSRDALTAEGSLAAACLGVPKGNGDGGCPRRSSAPLREAQRVRWVFRELRSMGVQNLELGGCPQTWAATEG